MMKVTLSRVYGAKRYGSLGSHGVDSTYGVKQ
jgi:hypothetical protein